MRLFESHLAQLDSRLRGNDGRRFCGKLKSPGGIMTMWPDLAEDQVRRKQIFMQDWERKLDEFLAFNERKVLPNAGTVSKKAANEHARQEYERFAERRREHKEAIGEAEAVKVLEDTAKRLMSKKPRNET